MEGQLLSGQVPGGQDVAYYAERFTTVEINYTFYRIPNEKILAGWDREPRRGSG